MVHERGVIDRLHCTDARRLFRILAEYVDGFEPLSGLEVSLVSVFEIFRKEPEERRRA